MGPHRPLRTGPAAAAAHAGRFHRQSHRIPQNGHQGCHAGARHLRLLPVLARHRHPPPFVVEHRDRRRRRRIHRPGQGALGRLPVRARDPGADLSRLFPRRYRVRALAGLCLDAAVHFLLCLRPVRDFSRTTLSPDPHGLAWRALLDGRLRLGLFVPRDAVGPAGVPDARPGAAVARGVAGALQDAAHAFRRSAGRLRR